MKVSIHVKISTNLHVVHGYEMLQSKVKVRRCLDYHSFDISFPANEQDMLNKIEVQIKEDIAGKRNELVFIQFDFTTPDLLSTLSQSKTIESKAIDNAHRLYTSCMNEETIETDDVHGLLTLIDEQFGGWPVLQGLRWNDSMFNFSQLWFKLGQYNNFVFYHIETKIDKKNTSMYRIRVSSYRSIGMEE